MSLNVQDRPARDLLEQAVDLAETGVATTAKNVGELAERASRLRLDDKVRSAAGRVADGTEALLDDVEVAEMADRRALFAVAAFAAVLALTLLVIARRRRARDAEDRA